jgi:hypothetical protein
MGQVYSKCVSMLSCRLIDTVLMRNSTILTLLRSPIHRKITTSTAAKMPVQRITMFKVADEADVPQFLEKSTRLLRKINRRYAMVEPNVATTQAYKSSPQTGRQALHPLRRSPTSSQRSSLTRLQRPGPDNLLLAGRCEILRREVRGAC